MSSIESVKENGLAIVFGGGIGDMVIFFDALDRVSQWRAAQGLKTVLVTKKANIALMHAARPDIVVDEISLDLPDFLHDATYRAEKWLAIKREDFDVAASPLRSKYADLVCWACSAKRKLTISEQDSSSLFNVWRHLNHLVYTERVETGLSAFGQYRDLAVYLGVPAYETQIAPFFPVSSSLKLPDRPYCVIAPTASEPAKCWEWEKVDKVIGFIISRTDLDICLCGGSEGEDIASHIEATFGKGGRVLNYMSKTDFAGWIKLIGNSRFCFGNDSASIHLASHQGVPALCVSSLFCFGYCQPYQVELLSENDFVPISVNAQMTCARCHYKDYRRCAGNQKCKKQVKAGGVYQCIERVDEESVLRKLDRLMRDLGISMKAGQ